MIFVEKCKISGTTVNNHTILCYLDAFVTTKLWPIFSWQYVLVHNLKIRKYVIKPLRTSQIEFNM